MHRRSCNANISIHAPTRGATIFFCLPKSMIFISIHAPTRGATAIALVFMWWGVNFNPRSYKRSDPAHRQATHASPHFNPRSYKRSDLQLRRMEEYAEDFNPRSYKRSDFELKGKRCERYISIHAPTRGATCCLPPVSSSVSDFNPRSYKRSDVGTGDDFHNYGNISIHAPTRGATRMTVKDIMTLLISIHAPTRGATPMDREE